MRAMRFDWLLLSDKRYKQLSIYVLKICLSDRKSDKMHQNYPRRS